MSELKWKWVYFPYLDAPEKQHESAVNAGYVKVLLKADVDKVITEDKTLYLKLQDTAIELDKKLTETRNQLRHSKYKRCLAMAKWCGDEAYIYKHGSEYDEDLAAWFGKWHKRWLEFAEKFKPNNEVNNG